MCKHFHLSGCRQHDLYTAVPGSMGPNLFGKCEAFWVGDSAQTWPELSCEWAGASATPDLTDFNTVQLPKPTLAIRVSQEEWEWLRKK